MKNISRPMWIITLLISLAAILPLKSTNVKSDTPVSLTVYSFYEDIPLEGVKISVYKVAAYNERGNTAICDDFKAYSAFMSGDDPAYTLASYVLKDSLMPYDSSTTGIDGKLTFPSKGKMMYPGFYLVIADSVCKEGKTYESSPLLLELPNYDETSGKLCYDVTVNVKNLQESKDTVITERSVVKKWADDNEAERPGSITVQLFCNGKVYDTVQLTSASNWQYSWNALPYCDKDGMVNQWFVTENKVEGYNVSISCEGTVFSITNTSETVTEKPASPNDVPRTGLLWWPVPLLLFGGAVCLLVSAGMKKTH